MDPDVLLIAGLVLACLTVPSFFAAYADRRSPRGALAFLALAAALVLWAFVSRPGGYSPADIPQALLRVLARILP
jgi:hypothetical protein